MVSGLSGPLHVFRATRKPNDKIQASKKSATILNEGFVNSRNRLELLLYPLYRALKGRLHKSQTQAPLIPVIPSQELIDFPPCNLVESSVRSIKEAAGLNKVRLFLDKQDPKSLRHPVENILKKLETFDPSFIRSFADCLCKNRYFDCFIELVTAKDLFITAGKMNASLEEKWEVFKLHQARLAEDALIDLRFDDEKFKLLEKYIKRNNEIEERIRENPMDYKVFIIDIEKNLQHAIEEVFPPPSAGGDQILPLNLYVLGKSRLSHDTLTQVVVCQNFLNRVDPFAGPSVEPLFPRDYLIQLEIFDNSFK